MRKFFILFVLIASSGIGYLWWSDSPHIRKTENISREFLGLTPIFDIKAYEDRYLWPPEMVADFQRTYQADDCGPEHFRDELEYSADVIYETLHLIEGKCYEQNYTAAFEELKRRRLRSGSKHTKGQIFALIGELYWHGRGVVQDRAKSLALFKQAFITRSHTTLLKDKEDYPYHHDKATYWNRTVMELEAEFGNKAFGPREWPPVYEQARDWFNSLNGKTAFETAVAIKEGTGGFDADPDLAFYWMDVVVNHFKYEPAYLVGFKWSRDEVFLNKIDKFVWTLSFTNPRRGRMTGNQWLKAAARAGQKEATPIIYCLRIATTTHMKEISIESRKSYDYSRKKIHDASEEMSHETDLELNFEWLHKANKDGQLRRPKMATEALTKLKQIKSEFSFKKYMREVENTPIPYVLYLIGENVDYKSCIKKNFK